VADGDITKSLHTTYDHKKIYISDTNIKKNYIRIHEKKWKITNFFRSSLSAIWAKFPMYSNWTKASRSTCQVSML